MGCGLLQAREIAHYYLKKTAEIFDGNFDSDKTLEKMAKTLENRKNQQAWEFIIDYKLLLHATFDYFVRHGKKYDHNFEGKNIEIKYSRRGDVNKLTDGLKRNPNPDVIVFFSVNTNNIMEEMEKNYGDTYTIEHLLIPNTNWIVFTLYQ